jgi:hypothetical protein
MGPLDVVAAALLLAGPEAPHALATSSEARPARTPPARAARAAVHDLRGDDLLSDDPILSMRIRTKSPDNENTSFVSTPVLITLHGYREK